VEPNNPLLPTNYPPRVNGLALDPLDPSTNSALYLHQSHPARRGSAGWPYAAIRRARSNVTIPDRIAPSNQVQVVIQMGSTPSPSNVSIAMQ
jgi:hypothetical protein